MHTWGCDRAPCENWCSRRVVSLFFSMTDPAGCRFFFFFSPCHSSLVLLFMLNLSSLSLHSRPPSTLIQLLISLPLSPDLPLPAGDGRGGFFFFFFLLTGHQPRSHGARATEGDGETGGENRRWAPPSQAKESAVGGRERTDPRLCFLMREKSYITVPPVCFSGISLKDLFDLTQDSPLCLLISARARVRSGPDNLTDCWDEV